MPDESRTRATFRSAEFGFFGVVVYTRTQTPRRCGLPFSAGVLVFSTLSWRPLRTSCWIVGMRAFGLLRSNPSGVFLCALRRYFGYFTLRLLGSPRPPRSGVSRGRGAPVPKPARDVLRLPICTGHH